MVQKFFWVRECGLGRRQQLGNRLQLALMREAIQLVDQGVTDAGSIDMMLIEALAPRWLLLGVFGTNHTNAQTGIREYYARYGETLTMLMQDLSIDVRWRCIQRYHPMLLFLPHTAFLPPQRLLQKQVHSQTIRSNQLSLWHSKFLHQSHHEQLH